MQLMASVVASEQLAKSSAHWSTRNYQHSRCTFCFFLLGDLPRCQCCAFAAATMAHRDQHVDQHADHVVPGKSMKKYKFDEWQRLQ